MKKLGRAASTNRVTDHSWITVVNPTNQRMLLQACDHCGVVKSENSVVRRCQASNNQSLISSSLASTFGISA